MKTPLALRILWPITSLMFVAYIYLGYDNLFWLFIPIFLGFILAEIRIKKGRLDFHTIYSFFSTPIKPRGLFKIEPAFDNSPKVSVLKGVYIILGGGIFLIAVLIFIFGFILS